MSRKVSMGNGILLKLVAQNLGRASTCRRRFRTKHSQRNAECNAAKAEAREGEGGLGLPRWKQPLAPGGDPRLGLFLIASTKNNPLLHKQKKKVVGWFGRERERECL